MEKGGKCLEKAFSCEWVEACTGFVEDEKARAIDEGSGDEHALTFPLGKGAPRTVHQVGEIVGPEEGAGLREFRARGRFPEIESCAQPAHDHFHHGLIFCNKCSGLRGNDPKEFPEIAPVTDPVFGTEHFDVSVGRCHKPRQRGEKRGLATAVGSEDDPMFSFVDGPIDPVQDADRTARDLQP